MLLLRIWGILSHFCPSNSLEEHSLELWGQATDLGTSHGQASGWGGGPAAHMALSSATEGKLPGTASGLLLLGMLAIAGTGCASVLRCLHPPW